MTTNPRDEFADTAMQHMCSHGITNQDDRLKALAVILAAADKYAEARVKEALWDKLFKYVNTWPQSRTWVEIHREMQKELDALNQKEKKDA